jgi:hypothetical protein
VPEKSQDIILVGQRNDVYGDQSKRGDQPWHDKECRGEALPVGHVDAAVHVEEEVEEGAEKHDKKVDGRKVEPSETQMQKLCFTPV